MLLPRLQAHSSAFFGLLLASLLTATPVLAEDAKKIEIRNPSFEEGLTGYWINVASAATIDPADATSGTRCLRIAATPGKTLNLVFYAPYQADCRFRVSFDARSEGEANIGMNLLLQEKTPIMNWPSKKDATLAPVKTGAEWKRQSLELGPVPAMALGKSVLKLGFTLSITVNAPTTLWLDQISLEAIPVAPAAPAAPAAAPASNPAAPSSAPAKTEGAKAQSPAERLTLSLPGSLRMYESEVKATLAGTSSAADAQLVLTAKDEGGKLLWTRSAALSEGISELLQAPGFYELTGTLCEGGKEVASTRSSLCITTPLPTDYYSTTHPNFGVWGVPGAELRRIAGAKWDRQLFFTRFQKADATDTPPAPERLAAREPVNIIRCLNILDPFKKMGAVPAENFPKLREQLRKEILSARGLVDVWETQNEPMVGENFFGSMQDVFEIMRNESEMVRQYDPGRQLAGVCINPLSPGQYAQYIGYFRDFKLGTLVDAAMLHPYIPGAQAPDNAGYVETLNRLAKELKEIAGREVPLYVSEIGYSTLPGGEVTEYQQAAYLARVAILNRLIPALRGCVWHIGLWNEATSRRELDFGILRPFPKQSPVREPKPAYAAWCTIGRQTYNAELIRELNLSRGIRAFLFRKQNEALLVCYSRSPQEQRLMLPDNGAKRTIVTVCGRPLPATPRDGVLEVALGEGPVYISGGKPEDYLELGYEAAFAPADPSLAPGGNASLQIHPQGKSATSAIRMEIETPAGWTAAMRQDKADWQAVITCPASAAPGEYPLFVKLYEGERCRMVWPQTIRVQAPTRLEDVAVVFDPTGQPMLRYKAVGNPQAVMQILQGDRITAITRPVIGTEQQLPLYLLRYGKKLPAQARFTLPEGYQWQMPLPDLARIPVSALNGADARTPESWPGQVFDIDSGKRHVNPADTRYDANTGWLRFAWDNDHFYLAAAITDATHSVAEKAEQLWNGDSLQIGLSVDQKNMSKPNNDGIQETAYFEFGVGGEPHKPMSWVWASMNRAEQELHEPVNGLQQTITRDGTVTRYWLALPWKTINIKPAAAMPLRISVTINDRDGQRHTLEWYEGIANGKSVGLYGEATLSAGSGK